jgi:hypothetical protein
MNIGGASGSSWKLWISIGISPFIWKSEMYLFLDINLVFVVGRLDIWLITWKRIISFIYCIILELGVDSI